MAVDTKELIAEAVKRLLMQKEGQKLTVKDIVDECSITRQTFYYHFEDIPDLLKWVLERHGQNDRGNAYPRERRKGLRCLFLLALNARPYVEHGLQTNYRDEIERMVEEQLFTFSLRVVEKTRPVRSMQPCGLESL